jgi:hypothetical protein
LFLLIPYKIAIAYKVVIAYKVAIAYKVVIAYKVAIAYKVVIAYKSNVTVFATGIFTFLRPRRCVVDPVNELSTSERGDIE